MHKLFIVRHGNTFEKGEEPRRIGARTELPLVASGLDQAEALGRHFKALGVRFERVWCSPLLRTRQTAERIISDSPDEPRLELDDFLAEIDHGEDENKTDADVRARIGAAALHAWDQAGISPPGWTVNAGQRLEAWKARFAELIRTEPGASLCVTSNGAARFALLAAELEPVAGLKLATGAYGVLACAQSGEVALEGWNMRPIAF
jgi:probable phosphoglycerate mutase